MAKAKIIGIDASRATLAQKTGVEFYVDNLLRGLTKLEKRGYKYRLYTNHPLDLPATKLMRFPKLWTQIRLSLEMMINPPDLLFVPGHVLPLIHPKKTVATIHDLAFHYYPQVYPPFQRWYLGWSVRKAVKDGSQIITISENTKNDLVKIFGADPEKITVTYLAASKPPEYPQKRPIRKPYFFYIGRIEEKKNLTRVLKAFAKFQRKHPTYQFLLAGKDGLGAREIKRLGEKTAGVQFLGYLTEKQKYQYLGNALAFVFPSLYEGFGIPVLEAMSVGCPVLTSDLPVMHEVGGDGGLYANPHSTNEIYLNMERLHKSKSLRGMLAKDGKKQVRQFSWAKCARQTFDVLTKTI